MQYIQTNCYSNPSLRRRKKPGWSLARFLTWQNWNFKNPINFLCAIFSPNQDLEKAFCSNIAPSLRTGSHFLDLLRAKCRKSIMVHIFWLKCPTDLRSTILSYIFNALFRDTPLAYFSSQHMCHVCHVTFSQKGAKLRKFKCTNTDSVKLADRPNMSYIFEKVMVQGPQKQYSQVSYVQIHKYKYTNTQIHFWSKMQIGRTCALFLKR